MRIAGLVILYQPSTSVINNIKTYSPFLSKLIVYDNTEIADKSIHNQILKQPNVVLIHDHENKGIAKRLNEGANMGINDEFSWLLTMDQDSFFEPHVFERYLDCLTTLENSSTVAMVGVEFEKKTNQSSCNYKTVQHLITSGSLVNLNVFSILSGFDEAIFIDDVDTDYCYNAIAKGYKIIKFENIFLNHALGAVSQHKSFKNFKTTPRTLHSPLRIYYMVRNYFYLNKKYTHAIFQEEKKRRKSDLLHRVKNNFLYGNNKLALLELVILGWWDFRRKKMGKKL